MERNRNCCSVGTPASFSLDRLATGRTSFAFETTLSGHAYVKRLATWKAFGHRIEIAYLWINSPQLALLAEEYPRGGHRNNFRFQRREAPR
jgi:predicted ABC-type ATPase